MNSQVGNHNYFIRPKQAWEMLGIARTTFYRYTKEKKDEGFPQIHKMGRMSIIRLSDVLAYQEMICGGNKNDKS